MHFKNYFVALLSLTILFTACNSVNDEDLFNSAKENISKGEYQKALTEFEQLVKEYPESKHMAKATLEIAKLYHGLVNKKISKEENYKRAVKNYIKYFENYPEDSGVEKAMFMTGFIYANELKDYDNARKYYNMFMEKYPNSELVPSVKIELENMGKDPNEIINKQTASK